MAYNEDFFENNILIMYSFETGHIENTTVKNVILDDETLFVNLEQSEKEGFFTAEAFYWTINIVVKKHLHSISVSCAIPPLVTATIVAGVIAEIECADSKKRRLGITPKTALFCCGSEHTLYNISVLEYNAKLEKKPRMRPQ